MALATGAAIAAGATVAAAYIDAKLHIREDLSSLRAIRWTEKGIAHAEKKKRASLWYFFEEQALRLGSERCLWSRTGGIYSWRETYDQACRYGTLLRSHGIRPRDLCAFYLQNSPEFLMALLGSWGVGSAPAMINYNVSGDALVHCLRLAKAKVLLVDEDEACRIRVEEVRPRIEDELGMKIVILDAAKKEEVSQLPADRPPDTLREPLDGEFPIFLLYTSGTTGLPKACRYTIARAWQFGGPMMSNMGLRSGPDGDTWYDCMPLYHGTGCCIAVAGLCSGLGVAVGKKFSVAKFWDDVRDSEATAFVYVGETARYLLAPPPSPRDKDHKVRLMFGNGMRPDVWKKFTDRFGIESVYEFFNSTEGVFSLAVLSRGDFNATAVGHHGAILRYRLRNFYVAVEPDYETGGLLRDPKTGWVKRNKLEDGGEMIVAVPDESLFPGYHNNPEATAKKFVRNVFQEGDLYYRSGDALRRDSEGRWFFLDRLGDTFRWKSENVSTAEVAEVIGRYPGVVEANVYGVLVPGHDGRAGCAAIFIDPQARQGFNFEDLLKHARANLPRYAVPVFLRLVEEMTPIHNNKQNKVPLRKEGVDPDAITKGTAGSNDTILWCPPRETGYVPFERKDWESLQGGRARL